jgi:hypothetical protein
MSFKTMIRYFALRRSVREHLPLLPRAYIEPTNRGRADLSVRAETLKIAAVARTDQAAIKLADKYAGQPIRKIIKAERRKRRKRSIFTHLWIRFIALW